MSKLSSYPEIRVEGYRGKWSEIDYIGDYSLLEHNTYGDETCYLVVKNNDVIINNGMPYIFTYDIVTETYDGLEDVLDEEGTYDCLEDFLGKEGLI